MIHVSDVRRQLEMDLAQARERIRLLEQQN